MVRALIVFCLLGLSLNALAEVVNPADLEWAHRELHRSEVKGKKGYNFVHLSCLEKARLYHAMNHGTESRPDLAKWLELSAAQIEATREIFSPLRRPPMTAPDWRRLTKVFPGLSPVELRDYDPVRRAKDLDGLYRGQGSPALVAGDPWERALHSGYRQLKETVNAHFHARLIEEQLEIEFAALMLFPPELSAKDLKDWGELLLSPRYFFQAQAFLEAVSRQPRLMSPGVRAIVRKLMNSSRSELKLRAAMAWVAHLSEAEFTDQQSVIRLLESVSSENFHHLLQRIAQQLHAAKGNDPLPAAMWPVLFKRMARENRHHFHMATGAILLNLERMEWSEAITHSIQALADTDGNSEINRWLHDLAQRHQLQRADGACDGYEAAAG